MLSLFAALFFATAADALSLETCWCSNNANYECMGGYKHWTNYKKVMRLSSGGWESGCKICAREARDAWVNSPTNEAVRTQGHAGNLCYFCMYDGIFGFNTGIYIMSNRDMKVVDRLAISGTKYCGKPKNPSGRQLDETEGARALIQEHELARLARHWDNEASRAVDCGRCVQDCNSLPMPVLLCINRTCPQCHAE